MKAVKSSWAAAGWYLALALLLTWPLLPGLLRHLPADLGDPVLNCWILRWDADHFLRFLSGEWGALRGFWSPPIFYPSPLALAYSEHLVVQAIEILPVYALTRNIVFCYNLLFLSTFVLSGMGVYLLVRSLTGNTRAAFLAGLLFAFVPYRIAQFPHVQVLSTQWMAFTLYGLHRYFETRRTRALVGAAAALLAQGLSCGYFLLFFAPFAAAFAAWEVVRRRLAGDRGVLARLGVAALAVGLAAWPFLQPYLDLRALGFGTRSLAEADGFSANLLAYLTGTSAIHGWGRLFMVFPAPEGELFPGFVLTAVIVWAAWREAGPAGLAAGPGAGGGDAMSRALGGRAPWRSALSASLGAWAVVELLLLIYLLAGGDSRLRLGPLAISLKSFERTLLLSLAAVAAFLVSSPRARRAVRGILTGWPFAPSAKSTTRQIDKSPNPAAPSFWPVAAIVAAVLSLGPTVRAGVKVVGGGPYLWLYRFVPGFDGLRVPARFGLIVALMLSVLAGLALDRLARGRRRPGLLVAALTVLFLTEILPAPIRVNGSSDTATLNAPGALRMGDQVPAVYRYLRSLPAREPVVEFPFGEDAYEVQYVYYSTEHGHPIVNGYSGLFPPRYGDQLEAFGHGRGWKRPWETLLASGARLIVLHEGAYRQADYAARMRAWFIEHGAHLVASFGGDTVFRLPSADDQIP